jgi:hypothetical protein
VFHQTSPFLGLNKSQPITIKMIARNTLPKFCPAEYASIISTPNSLMGNEQHLTYLLFAVCKAHVLPYICCKALGLQKKQTPCLTETQAQTLQTTL